MYFSKFYLYFFNFSSSATFFFVLRTVFCFSWKNWWPKWSLATEKNNRLMRCIYKFLDFPDILCVCWDIQFSFNGWQVLVARFEPTKFETGPRLNRVYWLTFEWSYSEVEIKSIGTSLLVFASTIGKMIFRSEATTNTVSWRGNGKHLWEYFSFNREDLVIWCTFSKQ